MGVGNTKFIHPFIYPLVSDTTSGQREGLSYVLRGRERSFQHVESSWAVSPYCSTEELSPCHNALHRLTGGCLGSRSC
jgi:hypothetical protein